MYALHARRLMRAATPAAKIAVVSDLKSKLRSRIPSYNEFEATFHEIAYSDIFTKQKKLVQYILGNISAHFSIGVAPDMEKMTIEHLSPQNPSSGTTKISDKEVARIGNLVYANAKINKQLANKSFTEKKTLLLQSHVPIDEHIKKATKWNARAIEERTKYLAKLAYGKIWRI